MPYYHVRVTKKSNRTHDALELDLSEDDLKERIVNRFLDGKSFMVGGQPIPASDVEIIRINVTKDPSKVLLPEIKARLEAERRNSSVLVIGGPSDEWYVTEEGEDVTRLFIKHPPSEVEEKPKKLEVLNKDVFIVHGTDHEPVKELAAILKKLGLNPIVLHEKPSKGRTVVEKLESYSNVGYAFVILTPDDLGSSTNDARKVFSEATGKGMDKLTADDVKALFESDETHAALAIIQLFNCIKQRARQNVVMEFGYFWGLIGRHRVCCLYKGDVELPSDMSGIVYVPFKQSINEIRDKVITELEAVGYEITE